MKSWQAEAIKRIDAAARKLKAEIVTKNADWHDVRVEINVECSKTEHIDSQYWNTVRSSTRYWQCA